jgi:hypothetical protein
MGFPLRDGKGWRPDSRIELLGYLVFGVLIVGAFGFFSGLDAEVEYIATAPGDYTGLFSSVSDSGESVTFTSEQVELLNSASKNSLGLNSIGSERSYCGGLRNGNVRKFRLADIIKSSDRTSISYACGEPFELSVHTHPSGSDRLSEEDKDISVPSLQVTCIQTSEISSSPITGKLNGISCYSVGNNFEPVSVYRK